MRALIAYNSFSGRGASIKKINKLKSMLESMYDVHLFESYGPMAITSYIIKKGMKYDLIVVCGGDGSAHEAINGIMRLEKKPCFAILPMGTCNDFARSLGYTKSIKKCLRIIKDDRRGKIDISKINDDYFNYGLAAGRLTSISYKTSHASKKRLGRMSYYLSVLAEIRKNDTLKLRVSIDGAVERDFELAIMLATNSRYLAGFPLRRKHKIYLNDNTLQLAMFKKMGRIRTILLFGLSLLFGEVKSKRVEYINASKIKIYCTNPVDYNTDGELERLNGEINISVIPDALECIASKKVLDKYFK